MKNLTILILLLAGTLNLNAQDFRQAIGLRGGLTPGFEYRFYTDETNSYKFLLSSRDNGIQLHGIKEFHQFGLFSFTDQLVFIYGLGIHAGYVQFTTERFYYTTHYYERTAAIIAGLDALAGVEYNFLKVPVSVGIEAKPYFDLFGRHVFHIQPFDFAFTIKYFF